MSQCQSPVKPSPMVERKRRYAMGFLLGLALVGLCFWLLYYFFYIRVLYNAQVSTIDPIALQASKIEILREDRDLYQKALQAEGNVCLQSSLEEEAPFFLLPEPSPNAAAPEPASTRRRQALDQVKQAMTFIQSSGVNSKGENFVATGAGFFVNNNTILTNRRLVTRLGSNVTILAVNSHQRLSMEAKIIAVSRPETLRDYAILRVNSGPNPPKGLKIVGQAKKNDRVLAFGFSDAKVASGDFPESIFSPGVISSILVDKQAPLISHTAAMSPRFRGGPLVDREGRVIGLNAIIRVDNQGPRRIHVSLGGEDLLDFLRENLIRLE
ncbi:MAG: serine protease [Deltaproteobacteria bacterium]|nr:serine protease [Deltaproteobacteria bacterium]